MQRYQVSDLPERHKAALRLADALMTQPGDLGADLLGQLHRHFRPDEVLELTLDVMKWNYQKVSVALGLDADVAAGALTDLAFDADGNPLA